MPNPLRSLLIKFLWNKRLEMDLSHFKEFISSLLYAIRGRSWVEKRNGILSLIRIIYEYGDLSNEQYNELIDAVNEAYPISSFTKRKKGQCPYPFTSSITGHVFKKIKMLGRCLIEFLDLIKKIHSAKTPEAKALWHNILFAFLEKTAKINVWKYPSIKLEDIHFKVMIGFYWTAYRYLTDRFPGQTRTLGWTIERLEESKTVDDAICYHRTILDLLKASKLPKKHQDTVKNAEKVVANYYGLPS